MNDLKKLSTPVLQDWWEHYVCPTCMSQEREDLGGCGNRWHSVAAVTYECTGSAFSPLSIPVDELAHVGTPGKVVAKYGRTWTRAAAAAPRRRVLQYV